jgi:hypothetical protein
MVDVQELERWRACYQTICDCVSVIGVKRKIEDLSETLVTEFDHYGTGYRDPFDGTWEGGAILAMSVRRRTPCKGEIYESNIDEAKRRVDLMSGFRATVDNDELLICRVRIAM